MSNEYSAHREVLGTQRQKSHRVTDGSLKATVTIAYGVYTKEVDAEPRAKRGCRKQTTDVINHLEPKQFNT